MNKQKQGKEEHATLNNTYIDETHTGVLQRKDQSPGILSEFSAL
jgi:hypothetical protein